MTRQAERAALLVGILVCLVAGAFLVASEDHRPAPDPYVERASYGAGRTFAAEHERNPGPSGFPANPFGTQAACQAWIDMTARGLDRADFLAGCSDETEVRR